MTVLRDARNTPEAWTERASAPDSWTAAGWTEAGQSKRFVAVLRHLEMREDETLLDYGCGTGRLAEFLPDDVTYYAHDWSPAMLERTRRDHPRAWILEELPDELYDHVVAIGPFNLKGGWSHEATWERLHDLWALHTRRTLVASLYRGTDPTCLQYTPEWAAKLARFAGCNRFTIDASHLPNDLLLVMRRTW